MLRTASAVAAALVLTASTADAQLLRFSKTAAGGIASTGNTLGLSKEKDANGPGTWDSIGTFTSLDPQSVNDKPVNAGNPWMGGTTWDWTQDGSTGVLSLPIGADVLYAELVWGGSFKYVDDVSAYLDQPVHLSAGGATTDVAPDPATAQVFSGTSGTGFAIEYYVRSAEVTAFVQHHKSGTYAVTGVPATANQAINKLNAAGWTLVVAYRDGRQPFLRNLSLFVGGSFVDEKSQQDYALSGFCAPSLGAVEGRVVVSAMEGDANLTGDQLLIGASEQGSFVNLSGPNNPAHNFFCSQINGRDGMVDTQGSFGAVNHDAIGGVNVSGGRQGWDITTVPLSDKDGQLTNDQTSAVIRTITTGDSYVPSLVAMELDVKAPKFTDSNTTADKPKVKRNDTVTVTAALSNTGEAPAEQMAFQLPLDPNLKLLSFQIDGKDGDANGNPVDVAGLASGVDAGTLDVGAQRTVTLVFEVLGPPQKGDKFEFAPSWHHNFVVCSGDAPIAETFMPPSAIVLYEEPSMTAGVTTGAGGGSASSGSNTAGVGGSTASAGEQPAPQDITQTGDCGCSLPGGPTPNGAALAALACVAVLALRRRRG